MASSLPTTIVGSSGSNSSICTSSSCVVVVAVVVVPLVAVVVLALVAAPHTGRTSLTHQVGATPSRGVMLMPTSSPSLRKAGQASLARRSLWGWVCPPPPPPPLAPPPAGMMTF